MIVLLILQVFVGIRCSTTPTTEITAQCAFIPNVPPISTGAISHWKLEEVSGVRVDELGANNLTDVNTVNNDVGKINNAALFVSANVEKLSSTNVVPLTGDFTISAWVNPSSLANSSSWGKGIVSYHNNETIGDYIISVDAAGKIACYHWKVAGDDPTGRHVTTANWVTTGTFQHIICRRSGGVYTIWYNGSSKAFNDVLTSSGWGQYFLSIGAMYIADPTYYWDGLIDEVTIWNRAISDLEIAALYNSGNGRAYPF